MVNTQAVRWLKESKNRYALRRFLTPDNWFKVKNAPVPSCQLTFKELVFVSAHINPDGEIQPEAFSLPLLPTPTINVPERTSSPPTLARLPHTTPSPERPHSQTIKTTECTTALPRTEGMTSQSFLQLESTVFAPSSLTKAAPHCHDAVLDTERSTRTTSLPSSVAKVILSNLALANPQLSTTDDLSLATMIVNWLKCTACTRLSQPWYQDILSTITLDLVGSVSVLRHYFYGDLALCNGHLYLLANAVQ